MSILHLLSRDGCKAQIQTRELTESQFFMEEYGGPQVTTVKSDSTTP